MQKSYEKILETIEEKIGLSKKDIEQKIKSKIDSLSGLISKDGAAHIVAHELGVELKENENSGVISLKNLIPGMKNVSVVGKVRRIFEVKEFPKPDGSIGKVRSMFLFDDSDSMRVVLWNDATDAEISEGDILRINKSYVKDNRGNVELNVSYLDNIEINPEGIVIKKDVVPNEPVLVSYKRFDIGSLPENGFAEVLGTIVQVTDIRFYEVCSICNKRLKPEGNCQEHGVVVPKYNYVLNMVLDDNTGNIRVVFFNDLIEKILGISREQVLLFMSSGGFEKVKDGLLGNTIKVNGRLNNNVMFQRLELVAKDVESDVDFSSEIESLRKMIAVEKSEIDETANDVDEEIHFDEEDIN